MRRKKQDKRLSFTVQMSSTDFLTLNSCKTPEWLRGIEQMHFNAIFLGFSFY